MSYKYDHVDLVRVLDGDTVELNIDLGNRIRWQAKFRLLGIDTPEIHGDTKRAGDAASARLSELLANGILLAETHKPDKFGRWLVKLTVMWEGYPTDVAWILINEGHGVPYSGGTKAG